MTGNSTGPVKSWLDRLMEIAVTLVVIGILLNVARNLIVPMIPFIVITMTITLVVVMVIILITRRSRSW